MKRILAVIAVSAAFVGALEDPAHSGEYLLWEEVGGWRIDGSMSSQTCIATASYEDGTGLLITRAPDTWAFSIVNARVFKDEAFTVSFTFDRAGSFSADMVAVQDRHLFMAGLSDAFMKALIQSNAVKIDGIGTFNLTGSAAAIKETFICQQTITEAVGSVSTDEPDPYRGNGFDPVYRREI